jgi:glucose/arabinose dehydrogenase
MFALINIPYKAVAQHEDSNMVVTKAGPMKIERLAMLSEPWGMTFLPDGKLLITEKPGRLRIYSDGELSEPVSGVPKVEYYGQGGLLDVEIDPDFTNNGFVYLYFTEAAEQQPMNAHDIPDPRFGPYFDSTDNVLKGEQWLVEN